MAAEYRHELKYLITAGQAACLVPRLRALMRPDPHAGPGGSYNIRSLYFDDYENSCLRQNEDGTDPREKFRLRIYGRSPDFVRLELKRKQHGKTQKLGCTVTQEQCRALMADKPLLPGLAADAPGLLRRLAAEQRTRLLAARVVVEYERTPFVHPLGNVRITLDSALCSSSACGQFLQPQLPARGVLPTGLLLLEVKFDQFLPDAIYRALQLENLQQTAFSKYALCRRYHL